MHIHHQLNKLCRHPDQTRIIVYDTSLETRMTKDNIEKSGSLDFSLATFIFLLSEDGYAATDETIVSACSALSNASNTAFVSRIAADVSNLLSKSMGSSPTIESIQEFIQNSYSDKQYNQEAPEVLGSNLVTAILNSIDGDLTRENVQEWFAAQFKGSEISFGFDGASRAEKIANIRKYIFRTNRPWMAQIAARTSQGLETQWVLVEDFTDTVTCMDPYPWDDIDEEYELSIEEFVIRWELADEGTIAIQ